MTSASAHPQVVSSTSKPTCTNADGVPSAWSRPCTKTHSVNAGVMDANGMGGVTLRKDADSVKRLSPTVGVSGPTPDAALAASWTSAVRPNVGEFHLRRGRTLPGTRLLIEDWLGDGATSIVYRGRHVDLQRPVAIKVLRASVNEVMRTRFLEEAQTTTRIDSPYVVDILDFGELADGRLYYAMELLQGHSLADELDDGAVGLFRCITLLRMACKGLAAAHRLGVVHRDIKPENMLVVRRWGREHLILLDFGLASVPNDSAEICGTPAYMAPEQIRGETVDGRTDIYALGCCAYELLTGRSLVSGHTVDELLQAHLEGVEPLFDDDAVVPPPFQAVIRRCLQLGRDDRPSSMEELEAAICEAQIEAGVRGMRDDLEPPEVELRRYEKIRESLYELGGMRMRKIRRVAIATLAGLTLVGTTLGWLDERRRDATAAAVHIDGHVERARIAAASSRFVYPGADADEATTALHHVIALETYDGPGQDDAEFAASNLRSELGAMLLNLGDRYWDTVPTRAYARDYYAQALVFDPSLRRARSRAGMTPGEIADLRARAEAQDFRPGELLATLPLVLLANSQPRADPARSSEKESEKPIAHRSSSASATESSEGRSEVAPPPPSSGTDETLRQGRTQRDREKAEEMVQKAQASLRRGDLDRARRRFESALRRDPGHPEALAGLSDLYFEQGRHQKAVHFARLALRQAPRNARNHVRLGDALYRVARYDDARSQYERAASLGSRLARRRLKVIDDR